jgi:1,4-dihydroxy-2-naphthoate octaprenyltransferase
MMFSYIVFNVLINVFPLVNNFVFFLSDGIILSQLTSLYMMNEFSMTCFLNVVPVLFVIQNHLLIKGIENFARDETKEKLSFVRLVGKHDAVFLFVIYSIFIFIMNMMDFVSTNYIFSINLWYTFYSVYMFGKLMEGKKNKGLRYLSFLSIIIYIAVYLHCLTYLTNPYPER